jgi:hypothetical protein
MYYYVITACCYNAPMKYFCSVEDILLFHWGILPQSQGLRFEMVHLDGRISFIDNRKQLNIRPNSDK